MKLYIHLFVYALMGFSTVQGSDTANEVDVVIVNGQIVDGNGGPRYSADIAINKNRIVAIGNLQNLKTKRLVDAKGMIVAPGFIDGHSHATESMVEGKNRLNESSLTQGVTTIVFGADGDFSPQTIAKMLDLFRKQGIGTNVGFYIGHNGIRTQVMGLDQQRKPSEDEIAQMTNLVREGMQMGAVGFSTGLMYEPGIYSNTQEVIELTKAIIDFGGIYDSHVRDPARALIASDQEVIDIGLAAGVAAKIAHLKAVCLNNFGNTNKIIDMVNNARKAGQNVVSDQYPYDGAKTLFLSDIMLIPESSLEKDLKKSLSKAEQREVIKKASENGINDGFSWLKATGYNCIRITHSKDFPQYEGKYLSQIAEQNHSAGFDMVANLIISAQDEIRITLGGVNEEEVRTLLVQPWNMIVSDGKYINAQSSTREHPRSTGTFTRVLGKYVRELHLLTLEQAIRKMTSQPSDFLGFSDRGRIEVGKIADIVVFDEHEISDQSDWVNPLKYSTGIRQLFVNGKLAIEDGVISKRAAGIVVKRTHKTSATIDNEMVR